MKAVLHFRAGPRLAERVASLASDDLEIVVVDEQDRTALEREIVDTDVLLHVLEPVTRSLISAAPRLKLIQKIGVGINTIDVEAAKEAGIRVANMPGTNSQAVAEHTLALILAVMRRVPFLDRATRAGRGWSLPPHELDRVGEVAGRTVGLVGYGEVPRRLAPVLRAMGARIVFNDRVTTSGPEFRELGELLAEADVVSLHVPSTPETRHLIDRKALAGMRRGAVLVNTARGDLVDEVALRDALASGHLAGAGVDVHADEPVTDGPLADLPTVVLTPHIAWLTPETIDRSLSLALENIERLRSGSPILNQII